jgi:hypothetical protein
MIERTSYIKWQSRPDKLEKMTANTKKIRSISNQHDIILANQKGLPQQRDSPVKIMLFHH